MLHALEKKVSKFPSFPGSDPFKAARGRSTSCVAQVMFQFVGESILPTRGCLGIGKGMVGAGWDSNPSKGGEAAISEDWYVLTIQYNMYRLYRVFMAFPKKTERYSETHK